MEVLSSLLERTKEGGYSLGVRVKGMALVCREGKLPSSYLGLPLGAPFRSISVIEEKYEKEERGSLKKEWYLLNGEVAFEVDNGRKVADI
ncbi:hypothetical protein CK203_073438 [Vitis vinifera]|uniref:Uncharacterized protein n=1 Tax=Vitis vinifera TaxID=29760 RepID=A0A438EK79_VITVI|nr:hypothetical protein CK203_073438 [Vitis vinifera]